MKVFVTGGTGATGVTAAVEGHDAVMHLATHVAVAAAVATSSPRS